MNRNINNLINDLHHAHLDNSKQQYVARRSGRDVSIMPVTSFVFEFFLFNSIYQVDWIKTKEDDKLIYHLRNISDSNQKCTLSEPQQQRIFFKFIKIHAKEKPGDLYRAFEPLIYLPKTTGTWTEVVPDARITKEQGKSFFQKIYQLQEILKSCESPSQMITTKKIFKLIESSCYYIYLVRNNIFHGSKTLGHIYEENQKRRIEVYDLFLKGLNSLFFLAVEKTSVASDFVPCPFSIQSLSNSQEKNIIDINTVWTAIDRRVMKVGDSRLISQFNNQNPPNQTSSEKSALFYPSSGNDLLTPLLLGLPYCTQFYFYEISERSRSPFFLIRVLKDIPSIRFGNQTTQHKWIKQENYHHLEFEYDGSLRQIFWIHADNLDFLSRDIDLAFYFHRGDGRGEGGSDQKWDSELLPHLINKIPPGGQCIFLTDGEPGGFDQQYTESFKMLNFPFIERGRKYYYGSLSNPSP